MTYVSIKRRLLDQIKEDEAQASARGERHSPVQSVDAVVLATPEEDLRAALNEALHTSVYVWKNRSSGYVLATVKHEIAESESLAPESTFESPSKKGQPTYSYKNVMKTEAHQKLLNASFPTDGSWKLFRDFTLTDIQYRVASLKAAAEATLVNSQKWSDIADLFERSGKSTVGELPDETLTIISNILG